MRRITFRRGRSEQPRTHQVSAGVGEGGTYVAAATRAGSFARRGARTLKGMSAGPCRSYRSSRRSWEGSGEGRGQPEPSSTRTHHRGCVKTDGYAKDTCRMAPLKPGRSVTQSSLVCNKRYLHVHVRALVLNRNYFWCILVVSIKLNDAHMYIVTVMQNSLVRNYN